MKKNQNISFSINLYRFSLEHPPLHKHALQNHWILSTTQRFRTEKEIRSLLFSSPDCKCTCTHTHTHWNGSDCLKNKRSNGPQQLVYHSQIFFSLQCPISKFSCMKILTVPSVRELVFLLLRAIWTHTPKEHMWVIITG